MSARPVGQDGFTLLELLLGCVLGALVVATGIELLRVHVGVARLLQARLASVGGASFALSVAARDAQVAGGDPLRRGVAALAAATADRVVLGGDRDGSGAVEADSAERVTLAWSPSSGGRFVRWLGNQSISIASLVAPGGLRLRYFDVVGAEIAPGAAGMTAAECERVRRVALALDVTERAGALEAKATLRTAAALRTRLSQ